MKDEQMKDELYWQSVIYAREVIYQQQTEELMQFIAEAENPAKGVGQVVSDLVNSIVEDGIQKGVRFTRPTIQKLFQTLISDVAEMAAIQKVIQVSSQKEVDRLVNEALIRATEDYAMKVKEKQQGNPAVRDAQENEATFKARNANPEGRMQEPTPRGLLQQ